MPEPLLLLFGLVTILSLAGMGVAWATAGSAARKQKETFDYALRAKEREVAAVRSELARLEQHASSIWEIDSLQLARRYTEAKQALDIRLGGFQSDLRRLSERRVEADLHLSELQSDDTSKAHEIERLRAEMARVQQETTRLEQILDNLNEVGSIPAQDVKEALARRRKRRAEILRRIERLTAEGSAKESEIASLRAELERIGSTEREIEREQEVVRSAGAILDNLLGITPEIRERLSALDARVSSSVRLLAAAHAEDPVEAVVRASRRSLPAPAREAEEPREPQRHAEAAPAPTTNGGAAAPSAPEGSPVAGAAD